MRASELKSEIFSFLSHLLRLLGCGSRLPGVDSRVNLSLFKEMN